MEAGARTLTRVGLELGGNNPFLVFEDADLDAAVAAALVAKLRNGGQTCVCANRLFVHEAVLEEFTQRFADAMRKTVVGSGLDPTTEVGPMIEPRAVECIQQAVDEAVADGAVVVCGGSTLTGDTRPEGAFYPPTVVRGVAPNARLVTEEIFGPVAPIIAFRDIDEVLAAANATEYGLAAYVFTGSLVTALRASEELEVGIVVVNRSVGGGIPSGRDQAERYRTRGWVRRPR
jgi:succinate-semialdehyde dehydrogenase / glutarate-semialdehyde dehydrogenase